MSKNDITAEYVRSLFDYSEETGFFTRKVIRNTKYRLGSIAGALNSDGYVTIGIDKYTYYGHRLAWLYVHGHFPASMLDHKNGDKSDNRIANLKEVTNSMNRQNRHRADKDSKSGLLGVTKVKNRWVANIWRNKEHKYLGCFKTKEEAHAAYINAKREFHYYSAPPNLT